MDNFGPRGTFVSVWRHFLFVTTGLGDGVPLASSG